VTPEEIDVYGSMIQRLLSLTFENEQKDPSGPDPRSDPLRARIAEDIQTLKGMRSFPTPGTIDDVRALNDRIQQDLHQFDQIYPKTKFPSGEPLRPRMVDVSSGAKESYGKFLDWLHPEFRDADEVLGASLGQMESYALRLALVLHLARWAAGESVDPDLCDRTSMDRRGGQTTARDLSRANPRQYPTSQAAEEALEELVSLGGGVWVSAPPTEKGGRPTRIFRSPGPAPTVTRPGKRTGEEFLSNLWPTEKVSSTPQESSDSEASVEAPSEGFSNPRRRDEEVSSTRQEQVLPGRDQSGASPEGAHLAAMPPTGATKEYGPDDVMDPVEAAWFREIMPYLEAKYGRQGAETRP
jgi:hypothetical protein